MHVYPFFCLLGVAVVSFEEQIQLRAIAASGQTDNSYDVSARTENR